MITIDFSIANIVVLTPHGALSADDFSQLKAAIDRHINANDRIPNLVIHVGKLPHWDSFKAFSKHLHFVRDHQKLVRKIAVVGDNLAVRTLPLLMDLFVAAKVRSFSEAKFDEAKQWAESIEDHPGQFEPIEGFPSDVIAIRAKGIITSQDYDDMLVPLVDEKLKVHDRLKFLIVLDDAFESYSGTVAWDDARFALHHLGDFGKIALVTDIGWIRHGAKLFAPLMKAELDVFNVAERAEADAWIKN